MPNANIANGSTWTKVAFGDVVQLSRERSSDPEADGHERFVGLEHIDPGDLKLRRWGNVADGVTFTNVFRPGQVLFGKRRAYQRKVAVADFNGVCSGDIYVLEPRGKALLPELLPFVCQTDAFFEHAVGTSAGSLSPRTNWDSLASFEFMLPPIEAQARIAEALGAFGAAAESMRKARQSALAVGRAFVEAKCWEAGHPLRSVVELAVPDWGEFRDGDWIESKDQSESGVRLLQLADIGQGEFLDKSSRFVSDATFQRLGCTEVKAGDLLIARMAEPIGRTCVVPQLPIRCITAVDCCIARIDRDRHDPSYWLAVLNSRTWTARVSSLAAGSTRTRISRTNLQGIQVPMPSLAVQRELGAAIGELRCSIAQSVSHASRLAHVGDLIAVTMTGSEP